MTLPRDHARCKGRKTDADECRDCARRLAHEAERNRWPMFVWYVVPPIKRPCGMRIENVKEAT